MSNEAQNAADLELVRRAIAGEPAAGESLARRLRCLPAMLRARNERYGGCLDADQLRDAAQDAFMLVWRKLPSYEGLARLESWVYPFCGYVLMNAQRKLERRPREEPIDEELSRGEPQASDPWEEESMERALDRLPEDEARVLRLKHFSDLTFETIGARLSVSINTVKGRYYRGLRRLQELLAGREQ